MNRPRGPDFLVRGAQKTGTSWICSSWYDHPQVRVSIKDLHFSTRERDRGLQAVTLPPQAHFEAVLESHHDDLERRRQELTASFAEEIDRLELLVARELGAWRC